MKKAVVFIILYIVPLLAAAQKEVSVYFDSNKYELKQNELDLIKAWLSANQKSKVVAINGYTDEDGSTGFNDTLAQRRVNHIFGLINGKIMIREDFKTRSFGKRHKMLPDKAKNRKVTIYYIREDELHRENEILGIEEEVKPPVKKTPVAYPHKIVVNDPRGGRTEIPLDTVFMRKVGQAQAGEKLKIDNLNFQLNTYAIVNESRPKLYELLEIMKVHPNLKIKLIGHICCINGDPRKLSYERAKAVGMFLRQNGIDKERVTFEGLGTTQPMYPLPENNEEERAANRRVEVMVIEND